MLAKGFSSLVVASCLLVADASWAQSASGGSIAGVVMDATSAVLPGVTVEAASPALIEKVRAVVSDNQGQYKIVDLRPGTYVVTFTLPGFSSAKREGVELTSGFTATVNAELRVGSVEETITVSGGSPVVDTQNVRTQTVLTREVLDAIPASKTTQGYAALTLGTSLTSPVQQDVGGSRGESVSGTAIHGIDQGDSATLFDGMNLRAMNIRGGGSSRIYKVNQVMVQEVTVSTGNFGESETGGVATNAVPKEGGNKFSFYSLTNYTGHGLQSNNLNATLRNRGLNVTTREEHIYDAGVALGGPIRRDRLWFYAGARRWATVEQQAGGFHNLLHGTLFYSPDLGQPAVASNWAQDESARLTWQATAKMKLSSSYSHQTGCTCPSQIVTGQPLAYEAAVEYHYPNHNLAQVTWSYPVTNKLIVDAGVSYLYQHMTETGPGATAPTAISVTELSTGYVYGSAANALESGSQYTTVPLVFDTLSTRYSATYVTGSHAFKVGLHTTSGVSTFDGYVTNNGVSYVLNNQKPVALTVFATPGWFEDRVRLMAGAFAQDQWTLKRLTLNLGVRWDHLDAYNPAQVRPGGQWVPPFPFPEQDCVPCWNDISPRLGAAYDVFGDGKTAIKGYVGKYMNLEATSIAKGANPAAALVSSTTRTWNDNTFPAGNPSNGNYVPDCELRNPLANGECGPNAASAFGTVRTVTTYDPAVLTGWGVRPYNWQASVAVQRELRQGVALNVAYYRTWYRNLQVTQNQAVTPGDYSPFCVTTPADGRIPGGGGNPLCGFFDLNPSAVGRVNNLITFAGNFGGQTLTYNGVDVSINARFGRGGLLAGGFNTGRQVADACAIALAHPNVTATMALTSTTVATGPNQSTNFCRVTLPWAGQTQVKLNGAYPLPWWDLKVAATFQNLPGAPDLASYAATNAQIAPSLGRSLGTCSAAASCTATATLSNLFAPNTLRENRLTQMDIRLSKPVQIGGWRLTGMFDVYNLFNASTITVINTRYGSQWLTPTAVLPGRLFKFGVQIDL